MHKQEYVVLDKKKLIRENDRLTRPPRLESRIKNFDKKARKTKKPEVKK